MTSPSLPFRSEKLYLEDNFQCCHKHFCSSHRFLPPRCSCIQLWYRCMYWLPIGLLRISQPAASKLHQEPHFHHILHSSTPSGMAHRFSNRRSAGCQHPTEGCAGHNTSARYYPQLRCCASWYPTLELAIVFSVIQLHTRHPFWRIRAIGRIES